MATILDYALTTVADVKESLGLASSDSSKNNLITRKINQATEMIEKYTGRRFKQTTYTNEEYDATGIDQLVLRQRPVIGTPTLQTRDTTLNDDDWDDVEANLSFVNAGAGVLDLNFGATAGRWNRYRVSYVAGYETIPADIAEAAATLAAFLVMNGTSGTNVKRKKEGQREIEFYDSGSTGQSLFEQLGIDDILNVYSNRPILAK